VGGQRAGVGDGDEGRGRQGRDRQTVGGLGDMRRWDEEGGPLCSFFARRLCATNVVSDNGVLPVGPIGDSTTVLRSDADPTGRKDRVDMNEISSERRCALNDVLSGSASSRPVESPSVPIQSPSVSKTLVDMRF